MITTIEQLKQADKYNTGTYDVWVTANIVLYMQEMKYDYKLIKHELGQFNVRIYS